MQPPKLDYEETLALEKTLEDSQRFVDRNLGEHNLSWRDRAAIPINLRDFGFKLSESNHRLELIARWLQFLALTLIVVAGLLGVVLLTLWFG